GSFAHFIMPIILGITLFIRSPYFSIASFALSLSPFIFSAASFIALMSYLLTTASTPSAILPQSSLALSTALAMSSIMDIIWSMGSLFEQAGDSVSAARIRMLLIFIRTDDQPQVRPPRQGNLLRHAL